MSFWSYCYGITLGVLREIWILISHANPLEVVLFWLLAFFLFWEIEKKPVGKPSIIFVIICSLYFSFLITITLLGRLPGNKTNFSNLFSTYIRAYNNDLDAKYDIVFNIVLFVPVGMLISHYKNTKMDIIILAAMPLAIEITQLITTRGVFELTDITNNFIGGMIGFGIARLISMLVRLIKTKRKGGRVERTE